MGNLEQFFISDDTSYEEFQALIFEDKTPYTVTNNAITTDKYSFTFSDKYKDVFKKIEYADDLIFGKDKRLGVTSIEIDEETVSIFYFDGKIEYLKARFWLMANQKLSNDFKKLQGDLHYKYIKIYNTYEEFCRDMSMYSNTKRDVYGVWNPREQIMIIEGITLYKGLKPTDVGVLAFDIESDGLNHSKNSIVYLITNSYRKGTVNIKKHFRLDHYEDCGQMIDAWCDWVREIDPDIINFWNGFGYDLPYLEHVASLYRTCLALGKDSSKVEIKRKPSQKRVDGSTSWDYHKAHIYGRQIIDGLFVALNYGVGKGYPSWGLKPIAEAEGLITPDRQFYDASKIRDNWNNLVEREKIIQYGIDDSEDTINLYFRMITSYFYTCISVAMPFEEMMQGATGKWVNSVLVRGYLQKRHSIPKASEHQRVAGGMSYGVPGIYSNVLKYDAASYYPSTILKFNIHNSSKDPDNLFVQTVRFFTEARLKNKKLYKQTNDKYYDDLQASGKIYVNSSYGLLGTPGLNFNSFEDAAEITRCCRAGLKKAVIWATGKDINYWWHDYFEEQDYKDFDHIDTKTSVSFNNMGRNDFILANIDTDALSFCKKDGSSFSEEEKDKIEKELQSIMYCDWEDDGEFSRVIVLKAKNYILLPKGETKFKIKGSAITDTKKEPALSEMLRRIIDSLLYEKNQEKEIYLEYIEEAKNIKDIKRWAVKKSVTKKLLEGTRKNETKVTDALDLTQVREGDKVWLYNDIDGMTQAFVKGEPVFYKKTGEPKMIPNCVLKTVDKFDGKYDIDHYLERVDSTLQILETVLPLKVRKGVIL